MKFKPLVETMSPGTLQDDGALCGWALARAHAKSGDALSLSSYLAKKPVFDEAVGDFAETYSDRDELDHAAPVKAGREGRPQAEVVDEGKAPPSLSAVPARGHVSCFHVSCFRDAGWMDQLLGLR